jgi:hypothetical protein
MLTEIKLLPYYPSASGIEFYNNHFYIIGDDANHVLITDSSFNQTDSIRLYAFAEKRIPKAVKADLEAATMVNDNGQQKLLLLGSGSLAPYRNTGWLIDPVTKQTDSIRLDIFYQRLRDQGLQEINIEGICSLPGAIILSNRGNKNYPENHLAFTEEGFWKKQSETPLTIVRIGINSDSSIFNGVSGMAYSPKTDQLIISVSTEDTRNNIDDGAIGKSYLWIVNNISAKRTLKTITPDKIIDLEEQDARFKGQKIESVCLVADTNSALQLVLAADNDNGSSTLFRIQIEKN